MAIVVLDRKGRVVIPKRIRDAIGAKEGTLFAVRIEGNRIVFEKIGKPSEKFAGIFRPKREIPEDLDSFVVEAIRAWWKRKESM